MAPLRGHVHTRCGARLFRLHYWTTKNNGSPTLASGLLAVPTNLPPRGVVSYQHGTLTDRRQSPSGPGLEGRLVAALFAGGGYLSVAADYIGQGTNHEVHPYLVAQSAANAVVDLLKASETFAKNIKIPWPSDVYLVGFPEGGYSTLVAQQALEALDDPLPRVVACAPVAGAFDLADISFPTAALGAILRHFKLEEYVRYQPQQ